MPNRVADITNQRFGRLVALKQSPERVGGRVSWVCRCDCGKTITAQGSLLRRGSTTSCGCTRIKDLTGQVFGRLTVISITDKRMAGNVIYRCRCECGTVKEIPGGYLTSGDTQSCGCIGIKDLLGKRFGKLTVIKRTERRRNTNVLWECKCDCGSLTLTPTVRLLNGGTQSCGCASINDLVGQRFGRLVVHSLESERINDRVHWKCICDCGAERIANGTSLKRGLIRSCGCLAKEVSLQNLKQEGHEAYWVDPVYAQRKSFIYLVEVAGVLDKIGIAFDMKLRSSIGEYTKTWWKREMTRAECWVVEQVALELTKQYVPDSPYLGKGESGPSEQRSGWILDDIIDELEELCDLCEEYGWEKFYELFLPELAEQTQ